MNVGELRALLTTFPPNMPIVVFFDRNATVTDPTGDRISGRITDYFDLKTVRAGEEVCPYGGFSPIAVMTVEEE